MEYFRFVLSSKVYLNLRYFAKNYLVVEKLKQVKKGIMGKSNHYTKNDVFH